MPILSGKALVPRMDGRRLQAMPAGAGNLRIFMRAGRLRPLIRA
jgi:hypothetical protein